MDKNIQVGYGRVDIMREGSVELGGLGNGSYGYFPTKYAFEYRCYESDTHKYAPGSAEEMAENLVEMLCELR